jgi:hypothetical protein
LGKREIVAAKDAGWQFLGRAKVILSTLLHLYPLNMEGVFGRLVTLILIPIWFILGLVISFIVPI